MKPMNQWITNLEGSASIILMQKAKELKERGEDIIDLAGGEPDFDTPKRVTEAAIVALNSGKTHYAVGKGIEPLVHAVAKKMQEENNIICNPNQVIITPGAKFAIYMAVAALINEGDEVIVFAPYWVSYIPIIEACGGTPVVVELEPENDYRLSKNSIENMITSKTKMMIVNYPNNPTGNILHEDEAVMLVDLIKKNQIYVVSDEIYEKIVFDDKKSISLASYSAIAEYVITVNGFSK